MNRKKIVFFCSYLVFKIPNQFIGYCKWINHLTYTVKQNKNCIPYSVSIRFYKRHRRWVNYDYKIRVSRLSCSVCTFQIIRDWFILLQSHSRWWCLHLLINDHHIYLAAIIIHKTKHIWVHKKICEIQKVKNKKMKNFNEITEEK